MNFAELIAPIPVERFLAEYYGRKPLHIPASQESNRAKLLNWTRLNELLSILPHWTEENLKIIFNSRSVPGEFYLEDAKSSTAPSTRRASTAKLDVFLAMGASIVANSVHEIAPEIRSVTDALGDQFSGVAGANVYCSFRAVQAFATHCDLHEAFALHCEGEKTWRLYSNRAVEPVALLEGDDAQDIIDQVKGPVLFEVPMRPGDLLYIPRGYYHDALASSEASLHVTFAVAPHTGRILFRLLEERAMQDPAFRAYLPDARTADGAALRGRLEELSALLQSIMQSPAFEETVAGQQRSLWEPAYGLSLPERLTLDHYVATGSRAAVVRRDTGAYLQIAGDGFRLDGTAEAAEWALGRPAFSIQELLAGYPHLPEPSLRDLVRILEQKDIFTRYEPAL